MATLSTVIVSRKEGIVKYFWKHCYGIGNDLHWALCDEESDKEKKVTDHLMVLFATEPKCLDGQPLTEQPMPKRIVDLLNRDQDICLWSTAQDDDFDTTWETSCGEAFCFNEGTPKENGYIFCTHCGKRIQYD